MSVQNELLKTLGGVAATVSGIAGAEEDSKPKNEPKGQKMLELQEANKKANEELAAAQEQKIQLQQRIKTISGRYGGRIAAKNREIARLKGDAE